LNNKDALYFILENLNVQGDAQIAAAIDMIKNQWFKLDLNQLLAQEGMQNFDFKGITEDYIENYYKALKNMDMKALYKELGNNPYE
jgi:ABC-type transporter MlaC component